MKELDFDELDRAVNSLMSSTPKSADPPVAGPTDKVVEIDDASKPLASQTSAPAPTPEAPTLPSPSTTTSLPSRRGGRFMDVVHPSSDMKKPDAPRPSRSGITVTPRANFDAPNSEPSKVTDEPVKEEPQAAPPPSSAVEPASAPATEHSAAKSEWPDPLDVAGYTHEPDTSGEDNEKEKEETPSSSSDAPKDAAGASSDIPLTSPFLPGAKVEKRPLGGTESLVEEPDHTPVVTSDTSGTQNDPNNQLPALPKDVEAPLPEELHRDLVEVESDTNASGIPKTEEAAVPIPASLPPEPPKQEEKPIPTGPTSIPQQYHEEPTSGEKNNGAIYDTDTYHQPLAHPAKKRSGWLVVVWVVIILLVGAAGGAALYFLGVF